MLAHKSYHISIHTIPDTFEKTLFVSKIDISSKDGESIMNIATSHAFAAESDAQVFGFQMGKNWIDMHKLTGKAFGLKAAEPAPGADCLGLSSHSR